MTIILISQGLYEELLDIQKNNPTLTKNFEGYGGLDRTQFSETEKQADKRINDILKEYIKDFRVFQNFCANKKEELCLKFQYDWSNAFTGVGYLKLTELLNGFESVENATT